MTPTVTALSLGDVRELVQPMTAVASVYVGPRQDGADDAQIETKLRRRHIARELAEQGADNCTIDAVVGFLARLPEHLRGYAVFAAADQILLAHPIDGVTDDTAAYGVPPKVAPLLAWLQRHPALVVARVERGRAELVSVPAGTDTGTRRTVAGMDDEVGRHFTGTGREPLGHRSEETDRHNAAVAAAAVAEEVDRVHARLVVVCGDPRAMLLLTDNLHRAERGCAIRHLPSAHSVIADHDLLTTATGSPAADAVAAHVRQEADESLTRVTGGAGSVQGADDVLESLAEGGTRMLLIHDGPGDHRRAWFGPDVLCAGRPTPGLTLRQGRLVDVAIRAALLTGAEVRILSAEEASGLDGGIAVLLRHA